MRTGLPARTASFVGAGAPRSPSQQFRSSAFQFGTSAPNLLGGAEQPKAGEKGAGESARCAQRHTAARETADRRCDLRRRSEPQSHQRRTGRRLGSIKLRHVSLLQSAYARGRAMHGANTSTVRIQVGPTLSWESSVATLRLVLRDLLPGRLPPRIRPPGVS